MMNIFIHTAALRNPKKVILSLMCHSSIFILFICFACFVLNILFNDHPNTIHSDSDIIKYG